MLVELEIEGVPALVEASAAYPDTTMFRGRDNGKTTLVVVLADSAYNPASAVKVDLTYPEFRWTLARSLNNRDPFLDLKAVNLPLIKKDYAQHNAGSPINDRFPHRPS